MIDSIVLRVNNIHQYPKVIDALRKEGEGAYHFDVDNPHEQDAVDRETGEITKDKFLQVCQIYYDDAKKTFVTYSNKTLTSSHYYLAYRLRLDRDYAEFNFSIPKYLYGTNILQFVPHKFEQHNYDNEQLDKLDYNIQITYERLLQFINDFIKEWFKDIEVSQEDIEVSRVDICYNQYFKNKEDALKYMDYQKRIKKKYLKDTAKNKVDWGTSIFLQTERYAAKIYHKGSEYTSGKGDRRHHRSINKKLGYDHFQIEPVYKDGVLIDEGLEGISDRILRYEITFKKAYMSYLFKKHLFAKNCPLYARMQKDYKLVNRYDKKLKEQQAKGESVTETLKKLAEFSKEQKQHHRQYTKILNKRNSFRLQISDTDKHENRSLEYCSFDKQGNYHVPTNALFSKELLDELFKVFLDFKKQFEIKSLDKFTDTNKRVINYNKWVEQHNSNLPKGSRERENKINLNHINKVLMLMQYHTFDEMVQLGIIAKRTKYNYIQNLKKIGLTPKHLAIDSVEIEKSEEFTEYHELLY